MNLTSNYSDSRKYLNILYFYECIMRVLKNFFGLSKFANKFKNIRENLFCCHKRI